MTKNYPMLIPCICTQCNHEWEAFFPDGVHDNAFGVECPECKKHIGKNINARFKKEHETH